MSLHSHCARRKYRAGPIEGRVAEIVLPEEMLGFNPGPNNLNIPMICSLLVCVSKYILFREINNTSMTQFQEAKSWGFLRQWQKIWIFFFENNFKNAVSSSDLWLC